MNYSLLLSMLLFSCLGCLSTKKTPKYRVGSTSWGSGEYWFIDRKEDTIKKLAIHEYTYCFTNTFDRFAVIGIKGKRGWPAIDIHENILFTVGNFPEMEFCSPDNFVEDRIRVIDASGKIGFANSKGKIVIKPQFELVTQFVNGFAIIQEECYKMHCNDEGDEIDPDEHEGCNHYAMECNRLGYIDKKGKIIKLGNYTFEELRKEIGWEW